MKWGIIGALDVEVRYIAMTMENKKEYNTAMLSYIVGNIGTDEVVLACSGVGPVNAAACAQMMIARFDVDCIVNTGIAGAIDSRLDILDVVVSQTAMLHDIDYEIYIKFSAKRVEFEGDKKLLEAARKVIEARGDTRCFEGRIATGNAFVTNSADKKAIAEKCNPMCVEMEGAAIAQVAYLNEKPFLIIRTISDKADDSADDTYNNFFEIAAHKNAEIAVGMIKAGI